MSARSLTWIVDAAEARSTGGYDGTSPTDPAFGIPRAGLADGLGVGAAGSTWVDQEFLAAQEVEPWMGPRAIPVWLPLPECTANSGSGSQTGIARGPIQGSTFLCREELLVDPGEPRLDAEAVGQPARNSDGSSGGWCRRTRRSYVPRRRPRSSREVTYVDHLHRVVG